MLIRPTGGASPTPPASAGTMTRGMLAAATLGTRAALSRNRVLTGSRRGHQDIRFPAMSGKRRVPAVKQITRTRIGMILAAVLFIAAASIIGLSFLDKARACSDLGGELQISPRATWMACRLPDGRVVPF